MTDSEVKRKEFSALIFKLMDDDDDDDDMILSGKARIKCGNEAASDSNAKDKTWKKRFIYRSYHT